MYDEITVDALLDYVTYDRWQMTQHMNKNKPKILEIERNITQTYTPHIPCMKCPYATLELQISKVWSKIWQIYVNT